MALALHVILLSLLLPLSYCADPIAHYCAQNYTSSAVQTNISQVISSLTTQASVGGFAIASSGQGNNTIYGLAQCRGDVSSGDCSSCLATAAQQFNTCPLQSDARLWYEYCFMRYDTDNFIGQVDTGFVTVLYNTQNVTTKPDAFDRNVSKIIARVNSDVVRAGSNSLGREKAAFTDYITIYALAQCTKDLQPMQCSQCLSTTLQWFPIYCSHRQGCQVLYSSCMVWYEIYPFYFPLDSATGNLQRNTLQKSCILVSVDLDIM